MQEECKIVYTPRFIKKFKNALLNYYKYDTYMDFIIIPFLWQKTLSYIPVLSYSDRKRDEVDDLLELAKNNDYQIRTLNFDYTDFKKNDTVTMRLDKCQTLDELFKSFSSKTRSNINKAKRAGFKKKIGNSNEMIEHFYQVYSRSMLKLGTPALEKGFFYALRDEFKDKIMFYNFYDGYKVVGGTCSFRDEEIFIFEWLGIDEKYKHKSNNLGYLISYSLIELGYKLKNIKVLDFGRSGFDTGTYGYKSHFKMYPVKIDILEPKKVDIYSKYKLASEIWKKLPQPFVDKFGCKLSKYLKDL